MKGYDIVDYDPHPRRRIIEVNTKQVDGYALEEIPETTPGISPGVALVSRDWTEIFLMKKHKDWSDDFYFEEAGRIIREQGIQTKRKGLEA